jgi:hypothetical protein
MNAILMRVHARGIDAQRLGTRRAIAQEVLERVPVELSGGAADAKGGRYGAKNSAG